MPTGLGGERIWLCPTLRGNNLDLSGSANHGTYAGGMGVVVDKYKGKQAYGLDGVDDYLDLGNVFNPTASFSIALWARTSVTAQQMFISKNYDGTTEPYVIRRDDGGGALRFYTYKQAYGIFGTSVANPFTLNEWASVVGVFDGVRHSIYFNGEKVASTVTNQPAFTNSSSLFIGDTSVAGWNVNGAMDDVRFFERALSPQEIAYLALQRGIEGSPLSPPITLKSRVSKSLILTPTESPPAEETSRGIIKLKSPSPVQPSFSAGYAKSASESANPNLWDGLVGAWMPTFGVTGDTLRDVSGNRNHGTLTNMDPATDWVTSEKGLALDFDGVDDYVRMVTPISISSHPFNVSVALKRFDTTLYPRIFDISDNTYQFQAVLDIAGNGQLKTKHTKWQPNSGGHSTTWGFIPTLNELEIISVNVYPSTNEVSLYRNGVKQSGSGSNNVNIGANSNFTYLGCRRDLASFSFMDGQFGFFHIHNRDLSPTEIKQLYVDPVAPFRQKRRVLVSTPPVVIPAETLTRLGLAATPFKTYTITDKGIVVEDANGKQFLMFVF